jgi:putative transcriptional regulator
MSKHIKNLPPSASEETLPPEIDALASDDHHVAGDVEIELNLTNHFLIAMPAMQDPIFGGSVVYLCEHNSRGAMGLVINKPSDMTVADLFDRIDLQLEIIPDSHPLRERAVMFGGPVQEDRGFVLHMPAGVMCSKPSPPAMGPSRS